MPNRGLTTRETEIKPLLMRGLTNKEIAAELNVSPITVRNAVGRMLLKFKAKNRTQLVAKLAKLLD